MYGYAEMARNSPLKDKPLRNPGQGLDEKIDAFLNDKLMLYVLVPVVVWVMAGMESIAAIRNAPRTPGVYAAFALGLTVYGGIRVWAGRKELRNLRLGRDGERAVGQFLEALRVDGARIFHDIPGDKFNLDHVVLAEQGVFVIETKTRTKPNPNSSVVFDGDQILIAGHAPDRDPITQSAAQVRWLRQLIKESTGKEFPVRGVVVFPGWFVERTDAARKSSLWVLEPKALPSFIDHEPKRISPSDVALAAFHLSRFIRSA